MATVGSYAAKTHLPALLDRVAHGETITITRHGKPVAQLVPVAPAARPDLRQLIADFKAFSLRQGRSLEGLSARELVEEGRRY
jgi:prevent-host-death family protein